jgi:hypothetical protein
MAKPAKKAEPDKIELIAADPNAASGVSPERAAQIEAVIALMEDGKSENAACIEVGIHRNTFRSAALRHRAADAYARGLTALAHDQIVKMEEAIADARSKEIGSDVARLEIDTRKWFASKFLPKQYGDKITQEHSGPDGGPIEHKYGGLDEDQLRKEIARRMELLGLGSGK